MVPLTAASNLAVSTALRKRIAESCQRDLSNAFVAWLLEDFNQPADLLSIAASAAKRQGAGQDFQTIAILGFAAAAAVLSQQQLAALKRGLSRLAGRSPVVSGVPMPFCADAVGILGIALGTAVIANPELTAQMVGWAMRFLKRTYDGDHTEDWQRCLFATADLKMGAPLSLPLPNGVAVADVRLALFAKRLINYYPETQVRQDAARLRNIAIQELPSDVDCERAALCLAAVEWVIRIPATATDKKHGFIKQSEIEALSTGDEGPQERRKANRPVRRNEKYEAIDSALREIAASRPKSHQEVFRLLDDRKVPLPKRMPFKAAGGWLKGFRQDRHAASAWLSQAWGRLGLSPFARGPKK
jgi:hypothetical protein